MQHKIVLGIVILGLLFSGCVGTNGKNTVWYSEKYKENITLYADHTAILIKPDGSSSGAWRLDNNQLTITWMPFGNVHQFQMNNTYLTDSDNDTWRKV